MTHRIMVGCVCGTLAAAVLFSCSSDSTEDAVVGAPNGTMTDGSTSVGDGGNDPRGQSNDSGGSHDSRETGDSGAIGKPDGGDSGRPSVHPDAGPATTTDGGTCPTAPITLGTSGQVFTLGCDIVANGTAFSITADDVTLDLNGHRVIYNASASGSHVFGAYVAVGVDRVTIKNGTILQGAGNTDDSPAIYLYGASWQMGPHDIHDLVIKTTGYQSNGIQADQGYSFNNSNIYRTYIEVHGDTTAMDGYGADPITVAAMNQGGIEIHDNILVAGHRGMQLARIGENTSNPSSVYNNRIQQKRRPGSKAPYGILVDGKSHNVSVCDNQIISDDGRGINLDGWGQGISEGASGNFVYSNRIDVQYSESATVGAYVENNVYGIRDRYSSGDNNIHDNVIMVSSDIVGDVFGLFVGSDAADPLMNNIVINGNTIIARRGKVSTDTPIALQLAFFSSIRVTNSAYIADRLCGVDYLAQASVSCSTPTPGLTWSNNLPLVITATPSPAAPSGVSIARFIDSYLVEWNNNSEGDVYEYIVYRDGVRLPVSPRGGTFYVDTGIGGAHTYSVSALTLAGVQGPRSADVTTAGAGNAWW